jgi:hypothetical protein
MKTPLVPADVWYPMWERCVDGAYTPQCSLRELVSWLNAEYLGGNGGVIHLEPITREEAEQDVHWAVASFRDGEWPEYCDLDDLLDDLNVPPFTEFVGEVEYIPLECDNYL